MLRSINRNIPFLLPFNLVIRFRKEEIIDDISLSSFKNRRPNWFERKSFHCLESLDILLQGKIIISSINISNNPLFFPSFSNLVKNSSVSLRQITPIASQFASSWDRHWNIVHEFPPVKNLRSFDRYRRRRRIENRARKHLSYSKTISRDARSNPFTMHYQRESTVQSWRRWLPHRLYQLSSKLRSIVRCSASSSRRLISTPLELHCDFHSYYCHIPTPVTLFPYPRCLRSYTRVHQACTISFHLDDNPKIRETDLVDRFRTKEAG